MLKYVVFSAVIALALADPKIGLGSFTDQGDNSKIVGGTDAKLAQFPYQVSLHLKGPTNSKHYCGGSVISPTTIVTAGHCVTEVNIGLFQHVEVLCGLVSQETPGIQNQKRKVAKTIVHPDFAGGVAPNDVAIHILEEPLTMNLFCGKITLPSGSNSSEPTGTATLSGWGSTSGTSSPSYPDKLQTASLDLISFDECSNAVAGSDAPLDENMVCTGQGSGKGACSGDSGGPLVIGTGANRVLTGIVSWGFIPCGQEGLPSVFTKVSSFVDWINENTA